MCLDWGRAKLALDFIQKIETAFSWGDFWLYCSFIDYMFLQRKIRVLVEFSVWVGHVYEAFRLKS